MLFSRCITGQTDRQTVWSQFARPYWGQSKRVFIAVTSGLFHAKFHPFQCIVFRGGMVFGVNEVPASSDQRRTNFAWLYCKQTKVHWPTNQAARSCWRQRHVTCSRPITDGSCRLTPPRLCSWRVLMMWSWIVLLDTFQRLHVTAVTMTTRRH